MEVIGEALFQNLAGEPIDTVRAGLHKALSNRKVDAKFDTRMPFEQFKRLLNEGKIAVYQDRMLAAVAAASGVVKNNSVFIFIAALAALIAAPFCWYFFSFYVGVAAFISAIILFKLSRSSLRNAVYMAGMSDKGKYRWLMSRQVLWVVWRD